jgi:mannose-6-phosphate isomerase
MYIPSLILLAPNRVWRTYTGGKTLDVLEGKTQPGDSYFAEDWIASTTLAVNTGREGKAEEGYSKLEINGQSYLLRDLISAFPFQFLGKKHYKKYGDSPEFLLKFLDPAIRLHIQAHPTISFAREYLNSPSGKTEAYIILGFREGLVNPYIYLGFQHPLTREAFKQAVSKQDSKRILACFEKIKVEKGDVLFVPGGLPHAIGEGIFMIEIMEPTDFVVRLEFERGGYTLAEEARFMGRGIDFAMEMIDFRELPVEEVKRRYFCKPLLIKNEMGFEEYSLIGTEQTTCFSVNRIKIRESYLRKSDCFHVGIVTAGHGLIQSGRESISLKTGDKFLIPYKTKEITYIANSELEIVLVSKEP